MKNVLSEKMNIILLGPPGSGKGTQAERISQHYGIARISTGDLLRKEVAENSSIGKEVRPYITKGLLVPNKFAIAIIENRLEEEDCKKGFLIDGFPRNVNQAIELKRICAIDTVLYLELSLETSLERLEGRRSCPKCDDVYHLKFNPPKDDELCNKCKEKLIQREDDKKETIIRRFETYDKETLPLLNYYSSGGLLKRIDVGKSIEDTFIQISGVLDSLKQ